METLHLLSLAFVAVTLLRADKEAFAWLKGTKVTLDAVRLHSLHIQMWAGLVLMIVTGLFLAVPEISYLLSDSVFIAKMLFVGTLLANGVLLGRLMRVATVQSFAETTMHDRMALVLSGGISFCAWVGAGVIGYFFL